MQPPALYTAHQPAVVHQSQDSGQVSIRAIAEVLIPLFEEQLHSPSAPHQPAPATSSATPPHQHLAHPQGKHSGTPKRHRPAPAAAALRLTECQRTSAPHALSTPKASTQATPSALTCFCLAVGLPGSHSAHLCSVSPPHPAPRPRPQGPQGPQPGGRGAGRRLPLAATPAGTWTAVGSGRGDLRVSICFAFGWRMAGDVSSHSGRQVDSCGKNEG